MANDRWDDDDVYRARRYGNDEDYERNFRREREPWGRSNEQWSRDSESRGGEQWGRGDSQWNRGGEQWGASDSQWNRGDDQRDRGPQQWNRSGEQWGRGDPQWNRDGDQWDRGRRQQWNRSGGDNPTRRYESTPVLGMDLGGEPRNRGDWRRFDEQSGRSSGGYTRDTDWSNDRRWNAQRGGGSERGFWERTKDEVRSWMGDTDAEHRREADHRGRGPRGYTRSDERIRDDLSDWLMEDRYVDASEIDVTVANGEVTLAGTVDSREMKRRAEDIAASTMGVKDVRNSLRVRSSSSYGTRVGETASSVTGTPTTAGTETSSSGRTSTSGEPRH